MKVIISKAERLWKIPQPVLGSMQFTQKRLAARNVDTIDLENFVLEPSADLIHSQFPADKQNYPATAKADSEIIAELKEKIAQNHLSLKGIALDPEKEIVITPGIRSTASLLALGLLNPGDIAAYPDPGLQYFRTSICLADGAPRRYSLLESNDYIINIASLLGTPYKRMKILFINYPHNPTGAAVDPYFYRELLRSLRFGNVLVAADCAHVHPGNPDPSGPLQIKNARGKAVEMHTFSTTFGIPGLGFALGHKEVITIIKILLAAQGFAPEIRGVRSAIAGFKHQDEIFLGRMDQLRKRREILTDGLRKLEWQVRGGRLIPFIWARPPGGSTSAAFARRLFAKAGVRVAPGSDFGEGGEGWLRLALSHDEKTLGRALQRLSEHSRIWQRKYRP